MIRSYKVAEDNGVFEIVNDNTGEIIGSYDDEEIAQFLADESYCDDEAMIRHEEETK